MLEEYGRHVSEGCLMKRVKLPFAPDLHVEFVDRDRAIQQVLEWAGKGTRFPIAVFGPEGCGKTAWLRQAAELLREGGYEVVYVDPLHREYLTCTDVKAVVEKFVRAAAEVIGTAEVKLATLAIDAVKDLLKLGKRKVAVLVDEVFQAIGLEKAGVYVKSLLNLIEYPPESYERIVAVVATSEGVSRREIGRHRWADLMPIWNMSKKGFEELYEKLPSPKPYPEDVWRWVGGNPWMLSQLYQAGWDAGIVLSKLARRKRLTAFTQSLAPEERRWLMQAVEDPDTLFTRERLPFLDKLVEFNLVVDSIEGREGWYWVDEPPPEKSLELGVGRYIAWQTPLHREAVRRVLEEAM
jgi:dephospho-CoA kinase